MRERKLRKRRTDAEGSDSEGGPDDSELRCVSLRIGSAKAKEWTAYFYQFSVQGALDHDQKPTETQRKGTGEPIKTGFEMSEV